MKLFILNLGLLATGALMLAAGANYFVEGASRIARRLGVSSFVIGVTLVALGTSLPEFFVSLVSALKGLPNISIGNVIGSNICNAGLVAGTAALLGNTRALTERMGFEFALLFISGLLLLLFCGNGVVSRVEGLVFLALLVLFTRNYYSQIPEDDKLKNREISLIRAVAMTLTGLGVLLLGSDVFVRSAKSIAELLGVSDLVIGLSVVALGTSLPELGTSIAAAVKGEGEIALGNVVGSNILNLLLIVGTVAAIRPISAERILVVFDVPYMIMMNALLFFLVRFGEKRSKPLGLLMLLLYFLYIIVIFKLGKMG